MGCLFVADLHLDPERPAITHAFLDFLSNEARAADALYILGDLFEVWIGDDDANAFTLEVESALAELTGAGTAVYLLVGNRDFLLGSAFAARTGIRLLADPVRLLIHDTAVVLMHGDQLCVEDRAYQRLRAILRHPLCMALLWSLPKRLRRGIGRTLRRRSARANANKPQHIMDASPAAAARIMREHGVALLIHGHTHRPQRHDGAAGSRFVLGDWDAARWWIEWQREHEPVLRHSPIA